MAENQANFMPPDLAEIVQVWPELPKHIKAGVHVIRLPLGLLVEKPRNFAANSSGGHTGGCLQEKLEGCFVLNGKRGFSCRWLCSVSINLKPEY
jgi:hypothetical protein